ncbi:imelysin family protein [uncultured Roseobacter sp.]|uniref:imelysin family protein n=1 Tax=uncultured Roseobacter sp. TaxID=114847 RepID=UPI0026332845|nr:imelysin family protein [uncultured Roseobacter sp.]
MRLALIFCVLALPALADVETVLEDHILPGHQRLVEETATLAETARADCTAETLRPAFHEAYDAWISVSHIQFGPIEDRALTIAMTFWPDPKDSTGKALTRLVAAADPIVDQPEAFRDVSAAAQGFTALERLLYDPQPDADYGCRLTRAITTELARKSTILAEDWPDFAAQMRTAGQPNNTRFQSDREVQRALYTALSTGLEFLHDQRLGRPLGTFDRPRPRRAEARRSERSLRHVALSLAALEELALMMSDAALPDTRNTFTIARSRAADLDDPSLQGVADPGGRFRVELIQQAVRDVQVAVIREIGTPLGITAGFNSLDGD